MVRRHRVVGLALVLVVLAAGTPALAAKDYRAERFDVNLDLEPDGSMRVTESITFAFGPDTFTYVFREVPTRRTDGIQVLGASLDGRPLTPGKNAGEYEVKRADNGRRRIVWHFEPLTASTHTFEVSYLVRGLVELATAADVVRWRALPSDHEYVIACATLTLTHPPSAALLDAPVLEPEPTRTWPEGPALTYERCPVERDESWTISARFAPRSLAATPPAWQDRAARHGRYLPTFLGIAALILTGGILGFVVFAINHRSGVHPDSTSRLAERPEHVPAGLGIALARSGHPDGATAFAALLDLAARGAIRIEEAESTSRFTKHDFRIVPADRTRATTGHERHLLDLLFTSKSGPRTSAKLSELAKILQSPGRWKRFTNALRADLRAAGLIDQAREHTRSSVTHVSIGIILLAIVGFVATVPFVNQIGPPALLMPGAVIAVALAGFIVASTLPVLTDEGLRRAGLWAAYGRYVKGLAKDASAPPSTETFGQMLPYAAGFGTAVAWARALEKHGMKTGVPWLHALLRQEDGRGGMGATIAMLSAGHSASSHTSTAGAGGAGATGGGSSGAG